MYNFGLPERTIEELKTYFRNKIEIKKIKIYGSRAKGSFHKGSDIDIALWLTDDTKLSRIKAELEDLPTPYKFDVVNYETLSSEVLKNNIDNDGIEFLID